jgi:protein SCO1/2
VKAKHLTGLAVASMLALTACSDRELVGFRRDPAPQVGSQSMPDLANSGAGFNLQAEPGGLLIVYFGYVNCPDFCPTTLSDLRIALVEVDEPERVEVAMISVDPDRDIPILRDYITSFFEDGHALVSEDPGVLSNVAAPFGVQWNITLDEAGEVNVAHTTGLYAIDETGTLILTWQFGVTPQDLAGDIDELFNTVST